MAITKEQAKAKVLERINPPPLPDPAPDDSPAMPPQPECVLLDEETIEKDWGWVFFYQSREYLEGGDELSALAGNAPYIVNRHDGSLHETGTAQPVEYYIEAYERPRSAWPRRLWQWLRLKV